MNIQQVFCLFRIQPDWHIRVLKDLYTLLCAQGFDGQGAFGGIVVYDQEFHGLNQGLPQDRPTS
jgi:hypothetical protein